jgi:hypothetical protein
MYFEYSYIVEPGVEGQKVASQFILTKYEENCWVENF